MTDSLLILGAGGHGKVVADAALRQGRWERVAFLDDACPAIDTAVGLAVLGKTGMAERLLPDYADAAVAIGNSSLRLEWLERTQKWILAIAEAHREAGETAAAEETGDAVSGNAVTGNGVPEGTQAAGEEE